jgi:hypothetical protein
MRFSRNVRPAIVLAEICLRDVAAIRRGAEALRGVAYPSSILQNGVTLDLVGVVEQSGNHFRAIAVAARGATPLVGDRAVAPGVYTFDSFESPFAKRVADIETFENTCSPGAEPNAALICMSRTLRTFFSKKTPLTQLAKQRCFLPLILVCAARPESLTAALQQTGVVTSKSTRSRRA